MTGQEREEVALREELERRIRILETVDESTLGRLNRLDWVVLILLGLVLPVILALVAR
jgi:hypothetical protein